MKLWNEGDKSKAVCSYCREVVPTTFKRRDVPFSDGKGIVNDILAGVCDLCDHVVSTPPQSTVSIKAARAKKMISAESQLPSI